MTSGPKTGGPMGTRHRLAEGKRIVVKIGSALLVDQQRGTIRQDWLDGLAEDIAVCRGRGQDVVIVSSGAIAAGRRHLNLTGNNLRLEEKQAAAATGQIRLAHAYQASLARHDVTVAQILLTLGDTEERRRHLNARSTLTTLLALGAVPVINENDTVATEEIRFGDNDRLGARVAQMISADTLVLLSDIDGLYTGDPKHDRDAEHIPEISEITAEMETMAGQVAPGYSSGGMATKLAAAKIATAAGCRMVIADGVRRNPLAAIDDGARCSWFLPKAEPRAARKQWIAGSLKPAGTVTVDDGAAKALKGGKSLLPAGVTAVTGRFRRGEAVGVLDRHGREVARGLSAYSGDDARRIIGHKSSEIEAILGYRGRDELIHRDDLVLTEKAAPKGERADERTGGRTGGKTVTALKTVGTTDIQAEMRRLGQAACAAAAELANASTEAKDRALTAAAAAIRDNAAAMLEANEEDVAQAEGNNLKPSFLDRLRLDAARIEAIAKGLEAVAALPDPVGSVMAEWQRPNGLTISRVRVPLGVIGIIYESRPNVTADAGSLCLKAGNAAILRGGSESFHSSRAIADLLRQGLDAAGLPAAAIQLVPTTDRAAVGEMLTMTGVIDIIVPRGGKSLIERVQKESRIPVIAHLEGLCHVYVDGAADLDMARRITLNAKMRRTGICGAAETLLVDRKAHNSHLPPLVTDLLDAGCEVRGDDAAQAIDRRVVPAGPADWDTEYLEPIISVRLVDGVDGAIAHIGTHGSHHTDSIVTEDAAAAERFLGRIDSAIVMWNASTQFADGGEFGMGAEIGISTGKLHARGPVGAEQLTSMKYVVRGTGQTRP